MAVRIKGTDPDGTPPTKTTPAKKAPAKKAASPAKKTAAKKAPAKKRAPRKTTVPEPVDPWDQQPKESAPAFEAFATYRDLGAARSLAKVGREVGKSTALMERWSAEHQWVLRATAYDKALDREWVLEQKDRRRQSARRNADLAQTVLEKVAERVKGLDLHEADILDLRRLIDSASRLERLALGDSTENIQVTGKGGGAIEVADVSFLTDEERLDRMAQIRDEINERLGKDGWSDDRVD